jgi:hypothetical protein
MKVPVGIARKQKKNLNNMMLQKLRNSYVMVLIKNFVVNVISDCGFFALKISLLVLYVSISALSFPTYSIDYYRKDKIDSQLFIESHKKLNHGYNKIINYLP